MRIKTTATWLLAAALTAALSDRGVQAQLPSEPQKILPPPAVNWTADQDHQQMMDQLGIKSLRPGPSGNEADPHHANYDESKANPYPDLPDALITNEGKNVTTPEMWWKVRWPEILEAMSREVYGFVPQNTPQVTWTAKVTDHEFVGRVPVIAKRLVGHVDNSAYSLIDVDINMVLVLPANANGPVPVLMMFGRPALPAPAQPTSSDLEKLNDALRTMLANSDPSLQILLDKYPAYQPMAALPSASPFGPPPPAAPAWPPGVNGTSNDPPATQQLIAAGWGYVILDPTSVQADNGAGLTRGIIGLINRGQPRKPEQWGALRAWAWGASRALDYLEKEPGVDLKHVGIEGVSRYGKAALVTEAYDQRFSMGLIGSSGEGGAKLHRRNWGEAVENLAGPGEYHWMAGNFLQYAANEATFGSKTAADLPVDAHELIALCAPRLVFISYGIPEGGDAKWLDQKGSYMATIAAQTVFQLLGDKTLGVSKDYRTATMPAVNVGLLDGQLAWRQHDGGHTDAPNVKYFITWADKFMGRQMSRARSEQSSENLRCIFLPSTGVAVDAVSVKPVSQ